MQRMTDQNKASKPHKQAYQKPRMQFFGYVRQLTQAGSVANEEHAVECNPNANSFGVDC
jgi:hypothetical protein